jgi:threonine/homoserine/homoserine lactone efflux protein
MFGTQNLGLFLLSCIALTMTPGQDTLHILTRSATQGRRAGLVAVAGIITGCFVQTFAAAFGLSAIVAASHTAFLAVKWLGAASLVFLGAQLVFAKPRGEIAPGVMDHAATWPIYRAGLFCNLSNAKTILFYLSFLPQFVAPESVNKTGSLIFLGCFFSVVGTLWCFVIVGASSFVARRLRTTPAIGTWIQRGAGVLFVCLGVGLAV